MKKSQLKQIIKSCIRESIEDEPLYVEYVRDLRDEVPFVIGGKKYEYVMAKYPDGKVDIGVYSFAGDVVYSYKVFQNMIGIKEGLKIGMSNLKVGEVVVLKKDVVNTSGLYTMSLKAGDRVIVKGLLPLHRLEVLPEKMKAVYLKIGFGKLPVVYDDEVQSVESGEFSHSPQMRVRSDEPQFDETGEYSIKESEFNILHVISKPVKNISTGEWVVKWMTNGKRDEDKTYYTDDLKDAQDTAIQMQKHANELNSTLKESEFNILQKEKSTRHDLDKTPNKSVSSLTPVSSVRKLTEMSISRVVNADDKAGGVTGYTSHSIKCRGCDKDCNTLRKDSAGKEGIYCCKDCVNKPVDESIKSKLKSIIKECITEMTIPEFDKVKYEIEGPGVDVMTKKEIVWRDNTTKEVTYTIPAGARVHVWFSARKYPGTLFVEYNGQVKLTRSITAEDKLTKFIKQPSLSTIEKWESDRGMCKTILGAVTEPDGYDQYGSPSWMLVLGVI